MKPYYEDTAAGIVIYHGDCRDVVPELRNIGTVVADPPYAIPTVIAQGRKTHRNFGDLSIPERYFADWSREIDKVLLPSGRTFLFCDQASYPVLFRAAYGLWDLSLLVWDKGRVGMGLDFRKSFELIMYGKQAGSESVPDGKAHPDILHFRPVPTESRIHPAQKPLGLIEYLLGRFPNGRVLDPFMGSGVTLRAAKNLGLHAIGIDIEEEWCEVAARRLSQAVLPLADAAPAVDVQAPSLLAEV